MFANNQDQDFYQNEFLSYSYEPCNDPEQIIKAQNPSLECIPLIGNKPLLTNETCSAGQYKHYHWTIQDYDVINDNAGSSIEFELTPCHGRPELYIKPQILYAGIPMCQLFETVPNSNGEKTETWPFPNNLTGTGQQGPDKELFELERKAKGKDVDYPGSFFSQQKWGHNGSVTSDDGRPQRHTISIPSISYGGFFVSVYCQTDAVFQIGITAQQKKEADKERYDSKDEDSLAMKIRRFGYEVDDKLLDKNWRDAIKDITAQDMLEAADYKCNHTDQDISCESIFYTTKFGLNVIPLDKMGANHPETTVRAAPFKQNATAGKFCWEYSQKDCEAHCCKWSAEGDSDIADFLKYGPFNLTRGIIGGNGVCRPATTKQSLCVTKKQDVDMSADNNACGTDEDRDKGGCDRNIQATMEVTFYTGETGGASTEEEATWPLFQVNHVEMNDCASQMDKVGHQYCWEANFKREVTDNDQHYVKEAGEAGYKWSYTCGEGSGGKKCDPDYQTRGKCFWDGTPHPDRHNETIQKPWTQNGDDCNMWTPCGVMRNGMPVMIEHKKGKQEELVKREIPSRDEKGKLLMEGVPGSYYIYGHVTDITRESISSTRTNKDYNRYVLQGEDTWLRFPARTWVRVEVPVFNNVTYFFNVLRKLTPDGPVESYSGVSAVTYFYHQTQLYSDTTIVIIAAVVVVALLFLLIPFIYTKRKIKEHLKKVYEEHKQRGKVNVDSEKSDETEKVGKFVQVEDM